jgi:hypothetical protein
MEFKLVSKNSIGVSIMLLLVLLLSQSRIFDFLFETSLGRTILIIFILVISYTNKILGIVSVLFIIIMFNQSNISYMEGFTDACGNEITLSTISSNIQQKKANAKQTIQNNIAERQSTDTTTTTETFNGREGFNTIDRERTMQKGKQSNSIPVFPKSRDQGNIQPSDSSIFFNSFSAV